MPKIQVDIPDELLGDLRKKFEICTGSKIPVANRHLVRWFIERHIEDIPEETLKTPKTSEEVPDPSGALETYAMGGDGIGEYL